jgi:hypothetical protein
MLCSQARPRRFGAKRSPIGPVVGGPTSSCAYDEITLKSGSIQMRTYFIDAGALQGLVHSSSCSLKLD